jgi:hypothetical protein
LQITNKLADGYVNNPKVSVEITTYRPFYVIGQVNKPGEYPFVNGMTVLNAVALAGGYTEQADDADVYVRRNGTAEGGSEVPADQTTQIYPGDVVRVSQTTFWKVVTVLSPIAQAGAPLAYLAVHLQSQHLRSLGLRLTLREFATGDGPCPRRRRTELPSNMRVSAARAIPRFC